MHLARARAIVDDVVANASGPVSVFVADAHGELVAAATMDGAAPDTRLNAQRKAYTAARSDATSTRELAEKARADPVERASFDPFFTFFLGGVAVFEDGRRIGAVGVSGLPGEVDERLALAAIERHRFRRRVIRAIRSAYGSDKRLLGAYGRSCDPERMRRNLGQASGISVGAVGAGCWAIGGPWQFDGRPAGWGAVDDDESIRAIRRGLELGITLFDTADVYGCGHSERVLGRAIAGHRDEVVISTKFGLRFDEATRTGTGADASPESVRRACEASLRRLGTDRIDLYQLHAGADGPSGGGRCRRGARGARGRGQDPLLRHGGRVARGRGGLRGGPALRRRPAAAQRVRGQRRGDRGLRGARAGRTGALTAGDGPADREVPAGRPDARRDDVRRDTPHWDYFDDDAFPTWSARVDAIRAALTSDGRTLAQGALAWIWARSPVAIPIPGFRTVAQIEENAGAPAAGPLAPDAMASVDAALGRGSVAPGR